ncbi:DUF2946 domain-containing protein [Sphaerotilus sp.]|uniref:DUF2946 domain-containing protein n=1 Tax=Sphaerotilus sp. TaxID=2093942 RepID=UPI002ACDC59F|nr:DUF2946 domain-containing protein [Sphaerotilus sp.]MDZ7855821.1 DUF2946 domain-containing protein [Sphaerotilus sp.]
MAILLASLAPSLSHALGSAKAASWIEICTLQGSKWIAEKTDDSPSAPTVSHVFEHCSFCSMHAATLGLPPSAELVPLPIEGHGEFPPAFYAAPRTPHAWVSARPRAPPQLS